MNDKELIINLLSAEIAKIAKVIFPSIPLQATQTLATLGINNKISRYENFLEILFDKDNNMTSPDEFWAVSKSILNDKPIEFSIFKTKIKITGKDIDSIKDEFNKK